MLRFTNVSLLSAALLVACGSAAPAELSASLLSDSGLIEADVRVVAPVQRGKNQLFVEVRPHEGDGRASLLSVRATMAAHGHEAPVALLERSSQGYHASELELFMSGRWEVELELSLDDRPDSASLPVDVP